MTAAKRRVLRPVAGLGTALMILLGLNVVTSLMGITTTLGEIELLERFQRGELLFPEEIERVDDRAAFVAILSLGLFVVAGLVWLVWQHRAQANLHALRLPKLEYSPGWAVGWWLIPFANLVKPFQTVRELWKASGGTERWWTSGTWPVIGWWWGTWIASNVIGRVAFSLVQDDEASVASLIDADRWLIANDLVAVVAGVLGLLLVRGVTDRQARLPLVAVGSDEPITPPRPDLPGGAHGLGPYTAGA